MYCRKCGAEISEEQKFCKKCGAKIEFIGNKEEETGGDKKDENVCLEEDHSLNADEQVTYNIILTAADINDVECNKLVRELTGEEMGEARKRIKNLPSVLAVNIVKSEADTIKERFVAAGAEIECKVYDPDEYNALLAETNSAAINENESIGQLLDLDDPQYDGNMVIEGSLNQKLQGCLTVKHREEILLEKLESIAEQLNSLNEEFEKTRNSTCLGDMLTKILGFIVIVVGLSIAVFGDGSINLRFIFGICIAVFGGMLMYPIRKRKFEEQNRIHQETIRKDYEKQYEYLSNVFDKTDLRLQNYLNSAEMKACKELIPEEYWSTEAISAFATYIRNKRADSLKEAINLYEHELHNERMEQMQHSQMVAAEQALVEQKKRRIVAEEQYKVAVNTNKAARAAAEDLRRIRKKL